MKTLNERMLENLIWIRENMIAKGKDVTKITEDIARLKADLMEVPNVELSGRENDL